MKTSTIYWLIAAAVGAAFLLHKSAAPVAPVKTTGTASNFNGPAVGAPNSAGSATSPVATVTTDIGNYATEFAGLTKKISGLWDSFGGNG